MTKEEREKIERTIRGLEQTLHNSRKRVCIGIVLDESSSMLDCVDSVISGFNEYIDGLKRDENADYYLTVIKFSDYARVEVPFTKLSDFRGRLHRKGFGDIYGEGPVFEPSGMTALRDGMGLAIEQVKRGANEIDATKSLIVTFTDGMENCSRIYNHQQLVGEIQKAQRWNNMTFTYIGSHIDSWKHASDFGISAGNYMAFVKSPQVVRASFSKLAKDTGTYTASARAVSENFFNP